jgi:predicted transcriptional regulator
MVTKLSIVSNDEGLENQIVVFPKKKTPPFENWSLINNMDIQKIAKLGLNASTHNVFWYMLSLLDYNNEIFFNQAECARELQMSPSTVCNSVKHLEKNGLISKTTKKAGMMYTYMINPSLVYKGENKKYSNTWDSFMGLASD